MKTTSLSLFPKQTALLAGACAALAMASAVPAMATITVIHYWDMGESEVAGGGGNTIGGILPSGGTQKDLVGTANLTNGVNSSGPVYTSNAAPGIGSTVAISLPNDGESLTYATPFNLTSNFGFQLWYNPSDPNNSRSIAYNGDPGSGANGFGFYQDPGSTGDVQINGLLVGVGTLVGPTTLSTGTWYDLALVMDGNTNTTTFYVNGTSVATAGLPNTPNGGYFSIGSGPESNPAAGIFDNARFFTFAPGAFSPTDLMATVPEPATLGLLGIGALGLLMLRKRQGKIT